MQNSSSKVLSEYQLIKLMQEAGKEYSSNNYEQTLLILDHVKNYYPKNAAIYSNRGLVLKKLNRLEEALESLNHAIQIKQDFAEAYSNRGLVLQSIGKIEEAIISYDSAIFYKKDYAEAYSNKAFSLIRIRKIRDAIKNCEIALKIKPNYAEAFCNLGFAYQEQGHLNLAIKCYDQAVSLSPKLIEAYVNRGMAFASAAKYKEAIASYRKAAEISPQYEYLVTNLLHAMMRICDWTECARLIPTIKSGIKENSILAAPFITLSIFDDPELQLLTASEYMRTKYPNGEQERITFENKSKDKIRIGYYSADFREHPVSYLTVELFELHNKKEFEIIAFSLRLSEETSIKRRVKDAFDEFHDVHDKSDREIAQISRNLGIDIAVDLGGHTQDNRVGIFSYKPAPIVIGYLGYLGTMGSKNYNYLIADTTLIPAEVRKFYFEKIIYLPSYQVNDSKRRISDKVFTRNELGLPDKDFIFCCFNNNYKILPTIFDSWMRILLSVKHSCLLLYAENQWVENNLKQQAKLRGVEENRIIFAKRISYEEYLARYTVCDLFLDTFPYNAGTTASDALWAGVPVLTCQGKSFQSRMAASLLKAIEIPELITETQGHYEALAIELSKDPVKLRKIREKLKINKLKTKLFDTKYFTQCIEKAYKIVHTEYKSHTTTKDIYIAN